MTARHLLPPTLVYLALPLVQFATTWLSLPWALAALALLAPPLLVMLRRLPAPSPAQPALTLPPRLSLLLAGSALLLAWIAGIGGYGYQTNDWVKHEALLHDLITRPWPVLYTYYTQPVALVYYIAFYLPAAAVGKLAGTDMAHAALLLWAAAGTWLSLAWCVLLSRRVAFTSALALLWFAGLDWLGLLLRGALGWTPLEAAQWREVEDWSDLLLQFDAPVNSLYWAPQHALVGWLAAALLLYLLQQRATHLYLVPVALTPLWSPFVTIGLLPLLAYGLAQDSLSTPRRAAVWPALRPWFSLPNLGAAALLALMALYYSAKLGPLSPLLVSDLPRGWLPTSIPMSPPRLLAEWLLFALLEIGLWGVALALALRGQARGLLVAAAVGLTLLTLYAVGLNNDLALRGPIPLLFVLVVLTAQAFQSTPARRWPLIALLLLGAITPLTEAVRQIGPLLSARATWPSANIRPGQGIEHLFHDDPVRFSQYVGNVAAPFFRLARSSPTPRPAAPHAYTAYGDQILLSGYQIQPDSGLAPGQTATLTLELHVFTQVIRVNYGLQLQLTARDGTVIWRDEGWPQQRPTSQPVPEIVWFDQRAIPLPNALAPGLYRLELAIVAPDAASPTGGITLPARRLPGDQPLGDLPPIGYLAIGDPLAPDQPLAATPIFGESIALRGISGLPAAPVAPVAPDAPLPITLHWTVRAAPERDLTGFVHLLDASGALVAQWDQPLLGGFIPARLWQPGLAITDIYPLTLPAAPGRYTLVAGLYDPADGQRLPVAGGGDSVPLGTVTIAP